MGAALLDGRIMSAELTEKIALRVRALKEKGVVPGLAVILVGNDPASEIYVRNKGKGCEETGMLSRTIRLEADTDQARLEQEIEQLNRDPAIHGILVQLPLPKGLSEERVLLRISPEKDVDAFHPYNVGRMVAGQITYLPCTPAGVMELIKRSGISVAGKDCVVIGRSNIVGKPMAHLLMQANGTVTVCHSRTKELAEHTRRADILVAAIGKADFVTADMVKPGAVVIDVGINRNAEGKLTGDVDFASVEPIASYITPVPGGVGPMTIAMLMKNTLTAAKRAVEGEI